MADQPMREDGLDLWTAEQLEAAEAAAYMYNRSTTEIRRAFLRALRLRHPRVVEYETREAERKAYDRGWRDRCSSNLTYNRDHDLPAFPDPRVPVTPKGRTVTLSNGRVVTALHDTSFVSGWKFQLRDGHYLDLGWDYLAPFVRTSADARALADLVEHPEATDG